MDGRRPRRLQLLHIRIRRANKSAQGAEFCAKYVVHVGGVGVATLPCLLCPTSISLNPPWIKGVPLNDDHGTRQDEKEGSVTVPWSLRMFSCISYFSCCCCCPGKSYNRITLGPEGAPTLDSQRHFSLFFLWPRVSLLCETLWSPFLGNRNLWHCCHYGAALLLFRCSYFSSTSCSSSS